MKFLAVIIAAVALTGCFDSKKDKDKKTPDGKKPTKDQSDDLTFQGFVNRLKIAVQRRDTQMLSQMMAPDFGYRWDDGPPGETPFEYWQKNNLWNQLAGLLGERWVPYEGYMVVPPTLAENPDFGGYRAGVRQVNGGWRFAYFVPAPPAERPASGGSAAAEELPPVPPAAGDVPIATPPPAAPLRTGPAPILPPG
jgi:hypothetical protein